MISIQASVDPFTGEESVGVALSEEANASVMRAEV
jgi:hypothetical protein